MPKEGKHSQIRIGDNFKCSEFKIKFHEWGKALSIHNSFH